MRGNLPHHPLDLPDHSPKIIHHLAVPETQHTKTLRFQKRRALIVIPFLIMMMPTIYLNDEFRPFAAKVNDESIDNNLVLEAQTRYLVPSQCLP